MSKSFLINGKVPTSLTIHIELEGKKVRRDYQSSISKVDYLLNYVRRVRGLSIRDIEGYVSVGMNKIQRIRVNLG